MESAILTKQKHIIAKLEELLPLQRSDLQHIFLLRTEIAEQRGDPHAGFLRDLPHRDVLYAAS